MLDDMPDDKLLISLFLISFVAFVLFNSIQFFRKKACCKEFVPFIMYAMAVGYAAAFTVHLLCILIPLSKGVPFYKEITAIAAFTEPKLDTKFMIFGGLAMWQYGFTGLIKTIRSNHS